MNSTNKHFFDPQSSFCGHSLNLDKPQEDIDYPQNESVRSFRTCGFTKIRQYSGEKVSEGTTEVCILYRLIVYTILLKDIEKYIIE